MSLAQTGCCAGAPLLGPPLPPLHWTTNNLRQNSECRALPISAQQVMYEDAGRSDQAGQCTLSFPVEQVSMLPRTTSCTNQSSHMQASALGSSGRIRTAWLGRLRTAIDNHENPFCWPDLTGLRSALFSQISVRAHLCGHRLPAEGGRRMYHGRSADCSKQSYNSVSTVARVDRPDLSTPKFLKRSGSPVSDQRAESAPMRASAPSSRWRMRVPGSAWLGSISR